MFLCFHKGRVMLYGKKNGVFSSCFKSRRAAMDVQNFGRFISIAENTFAAIIMKHKGN